MNKCLVGFGFGPIMSGLFVFEAHVSGAFGRLVVSEIDEAVVEAVRSNGGVFEVNVAHPEGVRSERVEGLEIFNPRVARDREALVEAIAASDEMATALPSVQAYRAGGESSVAALIARGISRRDKPLPTVVYAAENNNDAAELLELAIAEQCGGRLPESFCCVDTVIGKMSGLMTEPETISELGLAEMTPGAGRAILVEEFNRILVSRPRVRGWARGISAFVLKEDLEPFEEAKLYGHNAIHALLAYLADAMGHGTIADAGGDPELMAIAREAFLSECGPAMLHHHRGTGDPLFTAEGWRDYAEDLLERMVNPHLNDLVERVGRDPLRKLGWNDRLIGAMRRCLSAEVRPVHLAMGAAGAVVFLVRHREDDSHGDMGLPSRVADIDRPAVARVLRASWGSSADEGAESLVELVWEGLGHLRAKLDGRVASPG